MKSSGSNKLSKTISHALRHEPWLYELEIDEEGWVELGPLLAAIQKLRPEWSQLVEDDIFRAVEHSDKKRHELLQGRIRALYGHSLPGRLKKQPATPPEILFHGTSKECARRILEVGLLPMGRQYVHLSLDVETALAVGRRKTAKPVLVRAEACRAALNGVMFYIGNDRVWLANAVPATYLACVDGSAP